MTDELKKEFTLRITQANPISMITILYEIALAYLEEAAEAKRLVTEVRQRLYWKKEIWM